MSRKPRVLIVDDEILNLRVFERTFRKEFDVVPASCPADALACAREGEFDILFVDFTMPEMNGVELVRALRASGFAGLVVLVTGNEAFASIADALGSGLVAGLIIKPWERTAVREWVMRSVQAAEPALHPQV